MNIPQISVIIPIKGNSGYLQECLASVKAQSFSDIEVVAVLSKDSDCPRSLSEFGKKIKILHDNGQGLGEARNVGLKAAQGKYVAFLDADDCMAPHMLEKMWKLAEKQNADMVFSPVRLIDASGSEITGSQEYELPNLQVFKSGEVFCWKDISHKKLFSSQNCVVVWNKIYRRDFLEKYRILFLPVKRFEDNLFYYETLLRAKRIAVVWEKLYCYRQLSDSLSSEILADKNAFEIIEVWNKISGLPQKIGLKEEWLLPALYQQQALEYSHYYRHIPEACRAEFSKQIKTVAAPEVYEIFLRSLPVASWKKIWGVPLVRIKGNYWVARYFLFGFIPILKVRTHPNKEVKLFNFIKI